MKTATAPNVRPDRHEREWPASVPDIPDRAREPVDARSFDPTLGSKIGSEPYDDPTQGRQIGSDPYNDAIQGRTIGSDPEDDATRGSTLAAHPYDDPTQGRQIGSDPYDDPTRGGSRTGRSDAGGSSDVDRLSTRLRAVASRWREPQSSSPRATGGAN